VEIIELWGRLYFAYSCFDIVADPDKVYFIVVNEGVACAAVPVSGLADRAYIDNSLFLLNYRIDVSELVGV
jgi:hypothetical protein